MRDVVPVRNAIISVYYKEGIIEMAESLTESGVTIFSSGGTARKIRKAGMGAIDIADFTGFPPMFNHRVATLHPKVHGGILYRRDVVDDLQEAEGYDIPSFDLVVVNMYPVQEVIPPQGQPITENDIALVVEKTVM